MAYLGRGIAKEGIRGIVKEAEGTIWVEGRKEGTDQELPAARDSKRIPGGPRCYLRWRERDRRGVGGCALLPPDAKVSKVIAPPKHYLEIQRPCIYKATMQKAFDDDVFYLFLHKRRKKYYKKMNFHTCSDDWSVADTSASSCLSMSIIEIGSNVLRGTMPCSTCIYMHTTCTS